MFELYRRNKQFKKDLPKYRFAMEKWIWRNRKKVWTVKSVERYRATSLLEAIIKEWERQESLLTWLIIPPPDSLIKAVLSWD